VWAASYSLRSAVLRIIRRGFTRLRCWRDEVIGYPMSEHTATADEYAHFLISVYELCAAAHLGHLQVEIGSRSEEGNIGVPTVGHDHLSDWSERGLILDQITRCTISRPPR
jgi:hypothetical protein